MGGYLQSVHPFSLKKMGRRKGYHPSEETKSKISKALIGRVCSIEARQKMREAKLNEKHPLWKGDSAGIVAKHRWLYKRLCSIKKCCFCGKTGGNPHGYHWANIDHKYRRVRGDYIKLCAKCHTVFDMQFNGKYKK